MYFRWRPLEHIVKRYLSTQHHKVTTMNKKKAPFLKQTRQLSSLKFSDYDAYGFDIDHTLAKYNIPKLFDQIHYSLTKHLVDKLGYDESLKEKLDADFIMRGIVLDVKKGNFLKLAEDGTIHRASHGTKFLSVDEIRQSYGQDKHWPLFKKMIETVNNIGEDVRIFENFFDMPILMATARIIDIADAKGLSYDKCWNDMSEAIMDTFDPRHFELERGNFFPQWKKNTGDFVQPCSHDVKAWLKKMKEHGKVVFFATSSYHDFALASMDFVVGPEWKEYFDFSFTFARKPGFFNQTRPFLIISNGKEKKSSTPVEPGVIYSEGNSDALMTYLQNKLGKPEPKVLFFGDSLRSDVFPSKVYGLWDTVLVLEEMVCENHAFQSEAIVEDTGKRIKLAEPPAEEKAYLTSHKWGSFFTDLNTKDTSDEEGGHDKYLMNTLWGYMVRKYADISIPQLEYVADLSFDHEFHVFNHEKPFDWGFYPGLPCALQRSTDKVATRETC